MKSILSTIMKRFLLSCGMFVCLLPMASNSISATVTVYDTFGFGDTFSGSAMGIGSGDNQVGFSFTPSQSGFLSDIFVAASKISGNGDMIFELYSDETGIPGLVLETFTLSGLPDFGSNFTPQHLVVSGTTFLDNAQLYWLVASATNPADSLAWHFGLTPCCVSRAQRNTLQPDWEVVNSAEGSFRVQVSAIPIPAAVWLFGSGLLGLIGMARRKKTS